MGLSKQLIANYKRVMDAVNLPDNIIKLSPHNQSAVHTTDNSLQQHSQELWLNTDIQRINMLQICCYSVHFKSSKFKHNQTISTQPTNQPCTLQIFHYNIRIANHKYYRRRLMQEINQHTVFKTTRSSLQFKSSRQRHQTTYTQTNQPNTLQIFHCNIRIANHTKYDQIRI